MNTSEIDLEEAVRQRFPKATFMITVFDTVEEIETKTLSNTDVILYLSKFNALMIRKKKIKVNKGDYKRYFQVAKQNGETHVRFCDVIDAMIEKNYIQQFMDDRMNRTTTSNTLQVYAYDWSSKQTTELMLSRITTQPSINIVTV